MCEPIMGVWGLAPAGSRGRARGHGAKSPESESFLAFARPEEW